jgi:hypothetical protein
MPHVSPRSLLLAGFLLAFAGLLPVAASAWILEIRNTTDDLVGVCYIVQGGPSGCFGSADVPAHGMIRANTGTSCVGRWKVTRARDGMSRTLSRSTGGSCGDSRLAIRPDGAGFLLEAR